MQIIKAVKDRFQALHKQLGAAGYAKQEPLVDQRGRLKDLRARNTSVLARVRAVQAEASDAACVTAYTELVGDLRSLQVPSFPGAAGAALAVEALEAPVSTAALSVALDFTGVLAEISSLGAVQVFGVCIVSCLKCLLNVNCWSNHESLAMCVIVRQAGPSRIEGVFVRELNSDWNGIAYSPDDQFLVVSDRPTKSVQVVRVSDQSLVRSIGQDTLKNPRRLDISPDGTTVFVSDAELHAVLQYRMDGTLVRQIGSKGQAAGQFVQPWGLAVSKAGELFVADTGNHRVQVFRVSDGVYLRQIGGAKGSGNGQFNLPVDVALGPDETELLVVDVCNHRIQVCRTRDGQYLRGWGSCGSVDGRFNLPQSVVVTGSGEVVVADAYNHRVCVFDLDGTFHRSIDSHGSGPGQFHQPSLLAVSPSSRQLCVQANSATRRVQFFR